MCRYFTNYLWENCAKMNFRFYTYYYYFLLMIQWFLGFSGFESSIGCKFWIHFEKMVRTLFLSITKEQDRNVMAVMAVTAIGMSKKMLYLLDWQRRRKRRWFETVRWQACKMGIIASLTLVSIVEAVSWITYLCRITRFYGKWIAIEKSQMDSIFW